MGLSARQQASYWGLIALAFALFVWLMGNTLLPFIVGAAIAYLLDPWADWLESRGFSRVGATALITLFVVIAFIALLVFAVPAIAQQIEQLADGAPQMVAQLQTFLAERFPSLFEEGSALRRGLSAMQDTLRNGGVALVQKVLSSSLAVIDFLLLVVVSPVVAFYLLMDWDRMIARIDALIPREHVGTVRDLARDVDGVLGGFLRGQGTVCLILGVFYAVSLSLIGLNYGVIAGLLGGLLSFIPFVGALLGGILSVGLALFQFWGDWIWIGAVAAVFVVGQVIEGNVLTPKLVGDSVGLHPVWLIFALSAFGALFGFAGMLIAVPVAAVIGVLGRFAVERYKSGRLYLGPRDTPSDEAASTPRAPHHDAAE